MHNSIFNRLCWLASKLEQCRPNFPSIISSWSPVSIANVSHNRRGISNLTLILCQIAKVIHVGFIARGSFHWQSFSVCCPQFRWFNFHPSSISRKLFENNNPKLIPFILRVINMFNLIPSKRISYNWHNDWYIIYVKNLTIMWTQKDIFPNGNKFSNRRLCAF